MEEKKSSSRSKKVAVNPSGGVRKVETIEEDVTHARNKTNQSRAKKTVAEKVKTENEKADIRVHKAQVKKERKEHRRAARAHRLQEWKERRLEAKERAQERKLQAKERARERRLAHAARKDMLRNETAVQRSERKERERAEKIALRQKNAELRHALAVKKKEQHDQKRRLAAENRKHRREQRTERRKHAPGFGGWLAAVISLGVVSLAMLSIITVGAINMDGMSGIMATSYRSNLYEMTELAENLNTNLDKLRIATGAEEQRRLLTDILVESELMESVLDHFPVEQATTNNISSFVNRTASYAREGLSEIAEHGELGMENEQSLEYMYNTNASILKELQTLRNSMTEKDWAKLIKSAKNELAGQSLEKVNNNVIKTPSTIQDGPFSENKEKVTAHGLENESEITSNKATALVREYFADYDIDTVDYEGEAVANSITCFNFTLKDTRGREIYAQISKAGGKLIMFNSYEKCSANNFSQEKCVEIAQEFLKNLGMGSMHAVWLQENGTTANINFVYEQDGVLCYSDMVIVKVCETKGKVIGIEAMPYYLNHGERTIAEAGVTEEQAAAALGKLTPSTARLALIPYNGSERLTYEFSGTYGEKEFFVYVDAQSGREIETFTVLNTKQGRVIM